MRDRSVARGFFPKHHAEHAAARRNRSRERPRRCVRRPRRESRAESRRRSAAPVASPNANWLLSRASTHTRSKCPAPRTPQSTRRSSVVAPASRSRPARCPSSRRRECSPTRRRRPKSARPGSRARCRTEDCSADGRRPRASVSAVTTRHHSWVCRNRTVERASFEPIEAKQAAAGGVSRRPSSPLRRRSSRSTRADASSAASGWERDGRFLGDFAQMVHGQGRGFLRHHDDEQPPRTTVHE